MNSDRTLSRVTTATPLARRIALLAAAASGLLLLAGCGGPPDNPADSTIPWTQPQPYENQVPGFSGPGFGGSGGRY